MRIEDDGSAPEKLRGGARSAPYLQSAGTAGPCIMLAHRMVERGYPATELEVPRRAFRLSCSHDATSKDPHQLYLPELLQEFGELLNESSQLFAVNCECPEVRQTECRKGKLELGPFQYDVVA